MTALKKLFAILLAVIGFARVVGAADDKTIELAKKEGRVNFYTSMGAEESKVVADAFQAKHPGIRVDITRLGSEKLMQRLITEGRAGSHSADVTIADRLNAVIDDYKKYLR